MRILHLLAVVAVWSTTNGVWSLRPTSSPSLHRQAKSTRSRRWPDLATPSRFGEQTCPSEGLSVPRRSIQTSTILRAGVGEATSLTGNKQLRRELLSEFAGTYILLQLGLAADMSAIFLGSFDLFPISIIWAIAVTTAVGVAQPSGAHLNPAISLANAIFRPSKQFNFSKLIPYSIAQLLGAMTAAVVNLFIYGKHIAAFEAEQGIARASSAAVASAKAFGNYFSDPVTPLHAFFVELIGTTLLSTVVFSLTHPSTQDDKAKFVPALVGATVAALICGIAPLTQAGMNPARDMGPRIISFLAGWKNVAFSNCWLYILAPLIGAPLGAWFVEKVLYAKDTDS